MGNDQVELGFQYPFALEIRDFFRHYEAMIGWGSTFSMMLAAASGFDVGMGPPDDWDPFAKIVDILRKHRHVHQTLCQMDSDGHPDSVRVLATLYAPHRHYPGDEDGVWGELAALAPLSETVVMLRDDMAAVSGEIREVAVGRRTAASAKRQRAKLATEFWREVVRREKLMQTHARLERRLAYVQAKKDAGEPLEVRERKDLETGQAELRSIEIRHRAMHELLGKIIEAYNYDGVLRARIGAMVAADRELTANDAIRSKLAGESTGTKEERTVAKDGRKSFVAQVRLEAGVMRKRAHADYAEARRVVVRRSKEDQEAKYRVGRQAELSSLVPWRAPPCPGN